MDDRIGGGNSSPCSISRLLRGPESQMLPQTHFPGIQIMEKCNLDPSPLYSQKNISGPQELLPSWMRSAMPRKLRPRLQDRRRIPKGFSGSWTKFGFLRFSLKKFWNSITLLGQLYIPESEKPKWQSLSIGTGPPLRRTPMNMSQPVTYVNE